MVEVIPSIDVESFDEVKKRIRAVAPYVKWAHIDVSDGGFTGGYKSWHYFKDLIGFKAPVKLEIHLMINEMDFRWRDWVLTSADRLIFHLEAAHDPAFVITKIRENKKQVGLAIRPETAWQVIDPFAGGGGCDFNSVRVWVKNSHHTKKKNQKKKKEGGFGCGAGRVWGFIFPLGGFVFLIGPLGFKKKQPPPRKG